VLVERDPIAAESISSMCGRYTLTQPEEIVEELAEVAGELEVLEPVAARYNIAPTQTAAMVRPRRDTGVWAVAGVRWGLVPFWAKDLAIGNRLINARSETVASKPAFRDSFAKRRCLVLADGFFEWQKTAAGKQPFHFRQPSGRGLWFAGLWSRWKKEEKPLDTFTILTTTANEVVRPVHDRMPVILDADRAGLWLDPDAEGERLEALLEPAANDLLTLVPVARLVGSPANDVPECVAPIVL
jgi:putative SOS response-associated peptidase YedK